MVADDDVSTPRCKVFNKNPKIGRDASTSRAKELKDRSEVAQAWRVRPLYFGGSLLADCFRERFFMEGKSGKDQSTLLSFFEYGRQTWDDSRVSEMRLSGALELVAFYYAADTQFSKNRDNWKPVEGLKWGPAWYQDMSPDNPQGPPRWMMQSNLKKGTILWDVPVGTVGVLTFTLAGDQDIYSEEDLVRIANDLAVINK